MGNCFLNTMVVYVLKLTDRDVNHILIYGIQFLVFILYIFSINIGCNGYKDLVHGGSYTMTSFTKCQKSEIHFTDPLTTWYGVPYVFGRESVYIQSRKS